MDKRGICETEAWGCAAWLALIAFVGGGSWVMALTASGAVRVLELVVGLVALLGIWWLCLVQHHAARERADQRRKEALRAKLRALSPEERARLDALAWAGPICLSDDNAEDQIDAALGR
jgi:cobalamin biosynthesis protein CobD/CbiB